MEFLSNLPGGGLRQEKRTLQIDGYQLLKLLQFILQEIAEGSDAGIGDSEVQMAKFPNSGFDHLIDDVKAAGVAGYGQANAALLPNLFCRLARQLAVNIIQDYRSARPCQLTGNFKADPQPGAGRPQ